MRRCLIILTLLAAIALAGCESAPLVPQKDKHRLEDIDQNQPTEDWR